MELDALSIRLIMSPVTIIEDGSRRCTQLSEREYDAYLIYTQADRAFANKLAKSLAARKVEDRALRLFYDKAEIAPS